MNDHDCTSLFDCLDEAIDILDRNRTPDPSFVAAYDTLKQSRAMIRKALNRPDLAKPRAKSVELAA